ncbi:hypothetical protein [Defluviimonas sp. SAOS-178_SWC]|uniref:hypothetical protein n=1 Tax=Defluviimonas sp. SAOS-178_SWC TaxID=3121287 RepID=UPI003221C4C5
MQPTSMIKTFGDGFDHVGTEDAFRSFIAWWNEKSHFPVDMEQDEDQDVPLAA